MALGMSFLAGAQDTKVSAKVNRVGDTFIAAPKTTTTSKHDQETSYKWRDEKGIEYNIWLHTFTKGDKAGKVVAFIIRTSKKTGKQYNWYLPDGEEIAAQILKENE